MVSNFRKVLYITLCAFLFANRITAQETSRMLNVCSEILYEKQEELYDEVENYMMNIEKDSLFDLKDEILYHFNLGNLYLQKYKYINKAVIELEFAFNKIAPNKHIHEYRDNYKKTLLSLGISYFLTDDLLKSEQYLQEYIIEFSHELDICLYRSYQYLSQIYEVKENEILSKSCHDKCQEIVLKSYIANHPEHSFYYDNYKLIKDVIADFEKKNTVSEEYINAICSLGALLHKVDKENPEEPMLLFYKALALSSNDKFKNCSGLIDCYLGMQTIAAMHFDSQLQRTYFESIAPREIEYCSGELSESDIYASYASSIGAYGNHELAIEYSLKALDVMDNQGENKMKRIYQNLIYDYQCLRNDTANLIAIDYYYKLKKFVDNKDELYEWCRDNEPILLRYVYKTDEAIVLLKDNLKYYKSKYGKKSDQYISTLNQIGLTLLDNSDKALPYLLEAQKLLTEETSKSTTDALYVIIARCFLSNGKINDAYSAIILAEEIENEIYGSINSLTKDIKNQCLSLLKQ